jgi:hypothetical protein
MLSRIRFLPSVLFWLGFVLVGTGFIAYAMWNDVPTATTLLAELALMVLILACGAARWFRCPPASTAALIWLCALIWFVGISPVLSVVLIVAASMAVGSLFVPKNLDAHVLFAVLAGLALICGIDGWLLPFPIHGQATYVLVLLVICVVRWRIVSDMVKPLAKSWTKAVENTPWAALLAVMTLGMISTCAWLPTIHYDDLAYHLGLPYQLEKLGYYRMDASSSVWAVSAWAGDVLQGVAQVMAAGHEARGAVDVLWLILTIAMMWKLCEALGLAPRMRWLAVAIYASTPLAAGTLTGMQTEGATAAVAAGTALLIQSVAKPDRRHLILAALLFGLLLSLKVSNLMLAGPLGLWLIWQWRACLPSRAVPIAVLLALLIAGSSYGYAWLLTGNPMLPVYNAIFHSPYYPPTNFHDPHWNAGLHWNTWWDLVFDTPRYVEGGKGAAGFTLLALAGSLLVAAFDRRARPLLLVAVTAFVLPLTQLQYLRYPFPAFALLVPLMLYGVPETCVGLWHRRGMIAMLALLTMCNLLFVPAGDWQLQKGALQQFLTESRPVFLGEYNPIRKLAASIRVRYGESARTLITSAAIPFAAEFGGNAFVVNWYDQRNSARMMEADRDPSGKLWTELFERTGVNLLILKTGDVTSGLKAAIEACQGMLVRESDGLQLWELRHDAAGVATRAPTHMVAVGFDVSAAPRKAALLHAHMDIACTPQDVPVLVGWRVVQEQGAPWESHRWVSCLQNGRAHASIDLAVPGRITEVTATAQPAKPVDMGLSLISSGMGIRRDMSADRDLAAGLRRDMQHALANWISPLDMAATGIKGYAVPSPERSVVAKINTSTFPPDALRVNADVVFKCDREGVPIVLGWKIDEVNGKPWSHYEWATCRSDGQLRAMIDMRVENRVSGLSVTAIPKEPVDMGLGLVSLRASYLSVTGLRGFVNLQRLTLAEWLAPGYDIRELTL